MSTNYKVYRDKPADDLELIDEEIYLHRLVTSGNQGDLGKTR
jgi:hypothetical protein